MAWRAHSRTQLVSTSRKIESNRILGTRIMKPDLLKASIRFLKRSVANTEEQERPLGNGEVKPRRPAFCFSLFSSSCCRLFPGSCESLAATVIPRVGEGRFSSRWDSVVEVAAAGPPVAADSAAEAVLVAVVAQAQAGKHQCEPTNF